MNTLFCDVQREFISKEPTGWLSLLNSLYTVANSTGCCSLKRTDWYNLQTLLDRESLSCSTNRYHKAEAEVILVLNLLELHM